MADAARDALFFLKHLPITVRRPSIGLADDGEVSLEWRRGERHLIVSLDGDGIYGWAYSDGAGNYKPFEDAPVHDTPAQRLIELIVDLCGGFTP